MVVKLSPTYQQWSNCANTWIMVKLSPNHRQHTNSDQTVTNTAMVVKVLLTHQQRSKCCQYINSGQYFCLELKSSDLYWHPRCQQFGQIKNLPISLSTSLRHESTFYFQQKIHVTHGYFIQQRMWLSLLHSHMLISTCSMIA